MKKKTVCTQLDTDFTFIKPYLFLYSIKIEGENNLQEKKNSTFQQSVKTK